MNVCRKCGTVNGYDLQPPYIDYNENKFKFKRNKLYIRKYHILNTINNISQKNNGQISIDDRDKILKMFCFMNKLLPQVNGERKKMISINFILKKIFEIMKINCEFFSITKSKKT